MDFYYTFWAVPNHLEHMKPEDGDAKDEATLHLPRKWMGIENWPKQKDKELDTSQAPPSREQLRDS